MAGARDRFKVLLSASAALIAAGGYAHAQAPQAPPAAPQPAPAEAPPAEEDENEIIVIAEPGDQVRIDRRTYTLRDSPTAATTDMLDVLGQIPQVSVAPSGAVSLLGGGGVAIQIDGQPVPGANLDQVLRAITGADVERIEVITNPSAQHSAQASGGIINIITRRRTAAGFNGSLQISADNLGGRHAHISPSWSGGVWSLSGSAGYFGNSFDGAFLRERTTFSSGVTTTEVGEREVEFEGFGFNRATLGYRPNERRRMSVALDGRSFENTSQVETQLSNNLGPVYARRQNGRGESQGGQIFFDFQQQGERPRELLKLNAVFGANDDSNENTTTITPTIGASSAFATTSEQQNRNGNFKADYERPLEDERFMTVGGSFDISSLNSDTSQTTLFGVVGSPDYAAALRGRQQTAAAYLTYQFETGDWTWLPGVRAENYRREVTSIGGATDTTDLRYFPSLHIRREITSNIDLDLSYSSRIQRPGLQQLDPAIRFGDVNRASSGNPNLRPTTTDAYEANLTYVAGRTNIGVTLYDRINEDTISQFFSVTSAGYTLSMPINAGSSEQRGVNVNARVPFGEHWRLQVSGNVLNRSFDTLLGGVRSRRSALEYDGNTQIEYRDEEQNEPGADHFQLDLRFQGPRHNINSDQDEFITTNFTWRRRLTTKMIGVFSVQDIFAAQRQNQEVTTAEYFERSENGNAGTRFRFALTYQFGSGPPRPDQDGAAPSMPQLPMQ